MTFRPLRSACASAVLAAIACSSEPALLAKPIVQVDTVRRLQARETLRIGSVEDPDAGFTRIGAVDVDRDGNVYVVEARDMQIRVYSPEGKLLRTIGRRGNAPGEFRVAPHRIGIVGDTVWAHEYYRLNLFSRNGSVLSSSPYERQPVNLQPIEPLRDVLWWASYKSYLGGLMVPEWMRPDGYFVSRTILSLVSSPAIPAGVGIGDTVRVPRLLFAATGKVVDTLGWESYPPPLSLTYRLIRTGTSEFIVPEAPLNGTLRLSLPDGQIIVDHEGGSLDGNSFRVTRTDLAGDTMHSTTFGYQLRRYAPDQLDSIARIASEGRLTLYAGSVVRTEYPSVSRGPALTGSARADAQNAIRAAMQFPVFQFPIVSARLGSDGAIWLQREETSGTSRWLILEPGGAPRGQLEIPRGLAIKWSDGHTFWAMQRDTFDVEWLVKFQVQVTSQLAPAMN